MIILYTNDPFSSSSCATRSPSLLSPSFYLTSHSLSLPFLPYPLPPIHFSSSSSSSSSSPFSHHLFIFLLLFFIVLFFLLPFSFSSSSSSSQKSQLRSDVALVGAVKPPRRPSLAFPLSCQLIWLSSSRRYTSVSCGVCVCVCVCVYVCVCVL